MENRIVISPDHSVGEALAHLAVAAQEHQDRHSLDKHDPDALRLFLREASNDVERLSMSQSTSPGKLRSAIAKLVAIAASIGSRRDALDKPFPISAASDDKSAKSEDNKVPVEGADKVPGPVSPSVPKLIKGPAVTPSMGGPAPGD